MEHSLDIPEDLAKCVTFHGHLCPGLVYGYLVAKEAIRLMNLGHATDEETVAISENDSCAVDALQVLLGTSAGKGNLTIRDFGKNAFTIISRADRKSYRFVRKTRYEYGGKNKSEFDRLDAAMAKGVAVKEDERRLRRLKIEDLLGRPFGEVFTTIEIPYEEPCYAPLERSEPCAVCGEMAMATKMMTRHDGSLICLPCSKKGDAEKLEKKL